MSLVVKRYVPMLIMSFVAFFQIADTLITEPTLNTYAAATRVAVTIIGSFAIGVSATMLTRLHVRRISQKRTVVESSVLLICMYATLIWGLIRFIGFGVKPTEEFFVQRLSFDSLVSPGDSTIYSVLAFFIASAAYRAFRARSLQATILLACGVIVMLGKAPIGETIWAGFVPWTNWLSWNPNLAGARVIILSGILGIIALYVRMILGYERSWMGRGG